MKNCKNCLYFDGCDIVEALLDNDVEVAEDWYCCDWKKEDA